MSIETDESRLLTPNEIDDICDNWEEKTQGDIGKKLGNTLTQTIAKAQLVRDIEWEAKTASIKDADCQARIEGIFEEIENKASHLDLIDTIRINLDWLDWQALKKKEGIK